jgi:hypothetical protein
MEKVLSRRTRTVLRIRIGMRKNPDPGSGMRKNPDPGSRMNIPDLIFEKLVGISFLGKKYLNSLMRIRIRHPGSGILFFLNLGCKKIGLGILDPG